MGGRAVCRGLTRIVGFLESENMVPEWTRRDYRQTVLEHHGARTLAAHQPSGTLASRSAPIPIGKISSSMRSENSGMARKLGTVIPSTLDLILITLQRHAIRRPGCRVQHYGPMRLALVVSARMKGRLRCRKRPKSREETPKEGSDSGRATAHPI
jgi:hypothetical protein